MESLGAKLFFMFLLAGAVFCLNGLFVSVDAEPVYNPEIQAGPEYGFRKTKW